MPTLTVHSTAAADGRIRSSNATYATARAGSNLNASTGDAAQYIGQILSGGTYEIFQLFLDFDTSSIPDDATIDSATLSLVVGFKETGGSDFTIEARLHPWGGSLTTADYVDGSSIGGKTLLASKLASTMNNGVYTALTSDAAFVSNINKTGLTEVILVSSRFTNNNAPTGAERVWMHLADEAGTTKDPKLVVEYTEAAANNIDVDQAAETDTSQPFGKTKSRSTGQTVETDTAQALTGRKDRSFDQTAETDTAQPMGVAKALTIGQAVETDEAGRFAMPQNIAIGQATETDAAQVLGELKSRVLGQATETDAAQTFSRTRSLGLGQAAETDTANAFRSTTPTYVFVVGPTHSDWTLAQGIYHSVRRQDRQFWSHFGPQQSGKSVIRTDGTWEEIAYPTQTQIEAADDIKFPDGTTGKAFLQGGHETPITSSIRAQLVAAGFGDYIQELVDA